MCDDCYKTEEVREKIKIGDRVILIADYDSARAGIEGIVICNEYENGSGRFGVDFGNDFEYGHKLDGKSKTPTGYWVPSKNLKVINKKSIMKTLSIMMEKLLDADTRKLVKAGFINGDLNLTEEGKVQLQTIVFMANKAEMVKLTEEVIAEAEKAKNK